MDMTALIQALTKLHETSGIIQLASIIAIIASPLLAVWLTSKRTLEAEKRKDKMAILHALMTSRANNASLPYFNSLNVIDVVFHDSPRVRQECKNLLDEYWKEHPDYEVIKNKNLRLLEEIIRDVGYGSYINWEQISRPYAPKWFFKEKEGEEQYKNAQLQVMNYFTQWTQTAQENSMKQTSPNPAHTPRKPRRAKK